ncbi:MAG: hypothetical protein IKS63_00680, partial [Firmicutes bacterium]|nr:hypothetical protein [Bacillota bacterium]
MKRKRVIAVLLSLMIAVFMGPTSVWAADDETVSEIKVTENEKITLDTPDNDELYEQYLEKVFYGDKGGQSLRKGRPAYDSLSEVEKGVYDSLKAGAKNIADGYGDSAEIQVPLTAFGIQSSNEYTAEDLGLEYIYDFDNSAANPGLQNAIKSKLFSFDMSKVIYALYADCPYEFYWQRGSFSHGPSYSIGIGKKNDGTVYLSITKGYYKVSMTVDPKFRADGGNQYSVDTAKTGAALTAVSNAQTIVQNAGSMTDYNKLVYYKDQICSRVEYDYDAASSGSSSDGGPWAMIYVFDNDTNTKVVCEGYMEAFQYLCDNT